MQPKQGILITLDFETFEFAVDDRHVRSNLTAAHAQFVEN